LIDNDASKDSNEQHDSQRIREEEALREQARDLHRRNTDEHEQVQAIGGVWMITNKQLSQIWKDSREGRSFSMDVQTDRLATWIAECIGRDIIQNGETGQIRVPFLVTEKSGSIANLYCPRVMRFSLDSKKFVSPCGSMFEPEEIFNRIVKILGKSGVKIEISMNGNTAVVKHWPTEKRRMVKE